MNISLRLLFFVNVVFLYAAIQIMDVDTPSFWLLVTATYDVCCIIALWKRMFDFISFFITLFGSFVLNVLVLALTSGQPAHSDKLRLYLVCFYFAFAYAVISILSFKKYVIEFIAAIGSPISRRTRVHYYMRAHGRAKHFTMNDITAGKKAI